MHIQVITKCCPAPAEEFAYQLDIVAQVLAVLAAVLGIVNTTLGGTIPAIQNLTSKE